MPFASDETNSRHNNSKTPVWRPIMALFSRPLAKAPKRRSTLNSPPRLAFCLKREKLVEQARRGL